MNLGFAITLATLLAGPIAEAAATPGLAAYRSEREFIGALDRWRDRSEPPREIRQRRTEKVAEGAPAVPALSVGQGRVATAEEESITNVQTAGVDEGGIVKRSGDHLVILRRGRLFTVKVGGDALAPVAVLDAFAPGASPRGAWYDELLVSGSTVVVIGYSYARGGTEIGLFELGTDGSLAYRATHHLRSSDYYSSRNYASRLVGRTLVFYSALPLRPWAKGPWEPWLPAWRRWHADNPPDFQRILPATRIFRTDDDFEPNLPLALHTVTRCELGAADMRCDATAVLGPTGRVFYVSAGSVYVWTTAGRRAAPGTVQLRSALFRIPLDGKVPTGLKTTGVPIDQLSILEDASGHLNVLLRASGRGEGMFGAEATAGGMALLRVPLGALGDGRGAARREHYRALPGVDGWRVQNRYVGDWLLWGSTATLRRSALAPADGRGADRASGNAWALRYASGDEPMAVRPDHAIERIEAMGTHAVLIGNADQDLVFSALRLEGTNAQLSGRHAHAGARQGETRTHGFFYRPTESDEGVLGIPVIGPADGQGHTVYRGLHGSAGLLFLRMRALQFSALGTLQAAAERIVDDGCKASCVDWYGNARPIFLGERVFALMGYELVEGRLDGRGVEERIVERRRASFAPQREAEGGRYSPFN